MAQVRAAIRSGRKIAIRYRDEQERETTRTIWPAAAGYLDTVRILAAWCELRGDFRQFRTDRVLAADFLEDRYPERPAVLRARCVVPWRPAGAAPPRPAPPTAFLAGKTPPLEPALSRVGQGVRVNAPDPSDVPAADLLAAFDEPCAVLDAGGGVVAANPAFSDLDVDLRAEALCGAPPWIERSLPNGGACFGSRPTTSGSRRANSS
jgi:hypothetical protein